MKSRQRLMSAVVATLAVVAVPLSASAKNHSNNYMSYRSPAVSSRRTFSNHTQSFTSSKQNPSTSSFFHQAAPSLSGFFGGHANRNAFWNNSTAVNSPARYFGTNSAWNSGATAVTTPNRYYRTPAWNSGVTPVYNNYATPVPAYAAPAVKPVYYGGGYGGYSAGYAAPYASYPVYGGGYGYGGSPCNPYKAEKKEYNFNKLMTQRQNLRYEIAQSRSYGNWSNAHRLNTQLEYVNQQLGRFNVFNSCGAAAGYMPAPATAPTPYYGGYGYNGYNSGGYNGYGAPYGGGLTSMLPLLGNFVH